MAIDFDANNKAQFGGYTIKQMPEDTAGNQAFKVSWGDVNVFGNSALYTFNDDSSVFVCKGGDTSNPDKIHSAGRVLQEALGINGEVKIPKLSGPKFVVES